MHLLLAVGAMTAWGPCSLRHRRRGVFPCRSAGLDRHLGLGHLLKRLTGAMQWNDIVDVDILECRNLVAHIVFLIRPAVETADSSIFLVGGPGQPGAGVRSGGVKRAPAARRA